MTSRGLVEAGYTEHRPLDTGLGDNKVSTIFKKDAQAGSLSFYKKLYSKDTLPL